MQNDGGEKTQYKTGNNKKINNYSTGSNSNHDYSVLCWNINTLYTLSTFSESMSCVLSLGGGDQEIK